MTEPDLAARTWAAHLREGGTTEWSRWIPTPGSPALPAGGGRLPGAAQLELLRRINLEGPLPHRVDHVLWRPAPGRGAPQRVLPSPACAVAAPCREVLRVATGVLADLVVALPAGRSPETPPPRTKRRVPSFALDGLPVTVAGLRADLAAAGLLEHRPRKPWFGRARADDPDVVILVVGPVAEAFREVWSRRVQEGSGRRWRRFLGSCAKRDELPGKADQLHTVEQWTSRVGPGNVHVVTTDGLHDQVAGILGRRPGSDPHRRPGDPLDLPPTQLDVVRRINGVLPFLLPAPEQAARRARLVALLDRSEHPVRLEVPSRDRAWVAACGERLEQGIRLSGCPVHGEPAAVTDPAAATGGRLRGEDVLRSMVRMIHRVDAATAPVGGGPR